MNRGGLDGTFQHAHASLACAGTHGAAALCILLIVIGGSDVSAQEPACPGLTCLPQCAPLLVPMPGTDVVTQSGPTMGLLFPSVWAECGNNNCCGTVSTCTLTIGVKNVAAGIWTESYGISIANQLPSGFGMDANGTLTYEGSASVTIEGQTVSTCSLGRCQTSTQKVGPGYTSVSKTQTVKKYCLRKVLFSCGLFQAEQCGTFQFQAQSSVRYLSPQVYLTGTCGLPWSGCPQCVNPSQPTCPS